MSYYPHEKYSRRYGKNRGRCPKCHHDDWITGKQFWDKGTLYWNDLCKYCGHIEYYSKTNHENWLRFWTENTMEKRIKDAIGGSFDDAITKL